MLCSPPQHEAPPVSTTYTLSTAAHDGSWTPASSTWDDTATTVGTNSWAIHHFAIGSWAHTMLATGEAVTWAFTPNLALGGTVGVYVVVARDGVPDATTIPNYLLAQVGTIVLTGTSLVAGAVVSIDLTTASSQTSSSTTYAYTPVSGALGLLNAAWSKHDRDSSGAFQDRSLTLVVKNLTGGASIDFDDAEATNGPTLTVVTQSSNTGLVGTQYIRDWSRGRASGVVECPKTGHDVPADELVRDGYTGLLVSAEGYDPPEPKASQTRSRWPRPRRRTF